MTMPSPLAYQMAPGNVMVNQNGQAVMYMPVQQMCLPYQYPMQQIVYMQPTMLPQTAAATQPLAMQGIAPGLTPSVLQFAASDPLGASALFPSVLPASHESSDEADSRRADSLSSRRVSSEHSACHGTEPRVSGKQLSVKLRASVKTPLSGLAGALAKRLRDRQEVQVEAMGPLSITQSLRALNMANQYLKQDKIQVGAYGEVMHPVGHEPGTEQHTGLRFIVTGCPVGSVPEPMHDNEIHIQEESITGKAAGAIAKVSRSMAGTGKSFALVVGPTTSAGNTAAKSLTLARTMLHDDNIDIRAYPSVDNSRPAASGDGEDLLRFVITVQERQSAYSLTLP